MHFLPVVYRGLTMVGTTPVIDEANTKIGYSGQLGKTMATQSPLAKWNIFWKAEPKDFEFTFNFR